ncbi:MAG: hypothetical protein ACC642_10140, partial [Pseudomonadales bacterium]
MYEPGTTETAVVLQGDAGERGEVVGDPGGRGELREASRLQGDRVADKPPRRRIVGRASLVES